MFRYFDRSGELTINYGKKCFNCIPGKLMLRNHCLEPSDIGCPLLKLCEGQDPDTVDTTGCIYATDFGSVAPTIPQSQKEFKDSGELAEELERVRERYVLIGFIPK